MLNMTIGRCGSMSPHSGRLGRSQHLGCEHIQPTPYWRFIVLTIFDPFAGFSRLSRVAVARLSDEALVARAREDVFVPAVDVFEDKAAFVVKAELPGLKVGDVGIVVEKGVLTLSGERKPEKGDEKDGYCRVERPYGRFARSFVLPDTVDPEKIQAGLSDGVLTVSLSKKAGSQPRKIDIKVS
jgi:HSP20 family protein